MIIEWCKPDKRLADFEGYEWIKQDILTVDSSLDEPSAKKLFKKLSEKINPYLHPDIYKAIVRGGTVCKIAHLPVYIPPAPTNRDEYLNGHIEDILEQKWCRVIPSIKHTPQEKEPTAHQWLKAIQELDYNYAKYQLPKTQKEYEDAINWRKLVAREWIRIKRGVWVFIKGVPTFIPGSYYFFLNYWTNKEGRVLDYTEASRQNYLHREAVLKTQGIKGRIGYAQRQIGKTTEEYGFGYWVTLINQCESLCQGKSDADIIKNFGDNLTPNLVRLPFIFKPYSEGELKQALGYAKKLQTKGKYDKGVKDNIKIIAWQQGIGYNGGYIKGILPNQNAADGASPMYMLVDEFGKLLDVDLIARYDVTAPAVNKMFMITTVEDITDKNIAQCQELTNHSDYIEADINCRESYDCEKFATSKVLLDWCFDDTIKTFRHYLSYNKTTSGDEFKDTFVELEGLITTKGLVPYIKPTWFCFIDRKAKVWHVDEWGQSESEKSYNYLKKREDKIYKSCVEGGNMQPYYAHLRKYPKDMDDVFAQGNSEDLFDVPKFNSILAQIKKARQLGLNYIEVPEREFFMAELEGNVLGHTEEQKKEIDAKIRAIDSMNGMVKIPLFNQYGLEWVDGIENGEIEPIIMKKGDDPNLFWHWIAEMPEIPNNVQVRYENGKPFYFPVNTAQKGGIDGITLNTKNTTGKNKLSKFGMVIRHTKDARSITNNRVIHTLLFRPQDPKIAFEECRKALWFYGCDAGLEFTDVAVGDYMEQKDCGEFIALSAYITKTALNAKMLLIRGNTKTDKDKEMQFSLIKTHYAHYQHRCTSEELIKQLKRLKYANLTHNDLAAAELECYSTIVRPSKKKIAESGHADKRSFREKMGELYTNM